MMLCFFVRALFSAQGDHAPDNLKLPDGLQHSACEVLLISCLY